MKKNQNTSAIMELMTRGVEEIIDRAHLESRLTSGKKLRIKLGIDPTSPNIHIGRAVVLWKLRAFQDLGHTVVFIVGDFTGLIGDTSDKEAERPMMSEKQVAANLKSYFAQAGKIIDAKKAEMHYNSKWLKKMGFAEVGRLASLFGLHEFEARENIMKRMKAGKRVSLHELLYPLMQGYDSVAVRADVELGGTDQRFNLLAGRVIQKAYDQEPQDVLTMQLMEGTDGRKMSSSWGNVVNIVDEPQDMFGKIMSIPDTLIEKYFVLGTRMTLEEIRSIISSHSNPRDQKMVLAEAITTLYHGEKKSLAAKISFISQFSKGELPADIEEKKLPVGNYQLSEVLVLAGLAASKSQARRLLLQHGVKLNQKPAGEQKIIISKHNNILLSVGKRKFIRIK